MYISMKNVQKKFGDKTVLADMSLHVEQGKLLALLGPSGCGKTTLLNTLAGLVDIDGGSIEVMGQLYSQKGYTLQPEFRKIGMVFQDFALWPHMTVFENVAFGLKIQKLPKKVIQEKVMNTLEMVQMSGMERRLPNQLSGGQKQRVAIARALAPEPKLLLMDEPLSSLDAKLREQMRWQLMDIVSRTGVTTLYVTHDQVEALTMADHIVLLNQGEIEQEGSPRELYSSPQTLFCASFIGTSNLLACHIVQVKEKSALVDCQGFQLTVSMGLDALGGSAVCMIRPSDLSLGNTFDAWANSVGTTTWVIIQQRAYLGDHWQYRVKLSSHPHMTLEVWDSVEHHVGKTVALHIPAAAARLIRPKGNSLQSAPSPSVSSVVHQGKQEVRLL